jgi:hypothetical protein
VADSGFRSKAWAVLGAIVGAIALTALSFTLRYIGPASRVVYFEYIPAEELALFMASIAVGASLGWSAPHRFRRAPSEPRRLPSIRLAALGCLVMWIVLAQLRAFPATASAADREAWARARLPQYASLAKVVAAIPEVQRDVGSIVSIAPTGDEQHRAAREMNGDDMHFALDVVGQHGAGVFHADCTLDEARVYDWREGRWVMNGREQNIAAVPTHIQ